MIIPQMTRQDWKEVPLVLVMLLGVWGLLFGAVMVFYGMVNGKYQEGR